MEGSPPTALPTLPATHTGLPETRGHRCLCRVGRLELQPHALELSRCGLGAGNAPRQPLRRAFPAVPKRAASCWHRRSRVHPAGP